MVFGVLAIVLVLFVLIYTGFLDYKYPLRGKTGIKEIDDLKKQMRKDERDRMR